MKDTHFEQGLQVVANSRDRFTKSAIKEDVLVWQKAQGVPVWRLNQWYNAFSIMEALPVSLEQGGVRWELNRFVDGKSLFFKSVTLAPNNSDRGDAILSLNGLSEYALVANASMGNKGIYIQSLQEAWPHLLLAQTLRSDRLSHFEKVVFSLDAKLLEHQGSIREGYKKNLHAARFVAAISIQNTLSQNNFWLMLPIYDNRFAFSGFGCRKCPDDNEQNCYHPKSLTDEGRWLCPVDGENWERNNEKIGSFSMMFRVPTKALTEDNIHDGAWVHFETDLLPFIKAGIEAARQSKKAPGFSPGLSRYRIVLFTLGWEITGLDVASMQIRNLQLNAVKRSHKHVGQKFFFQN